MNSVIKRSYAFRSVLKLEEECHIDIAVWFWNYASVGRPRKKEALDNMYVTSGFLIKNALLPISTLISLCKLNYVLFASGFLLLVCWLVLWIFFFLSSFHLISFFFLSSQRTQFLNMKDLFP